jgi:hypothetical protein
MTAQVLMMREINRGPSTVAVAEVNPEDVAAAVVAPPSAGRVVVAV